MHREMGVQCTGGWGCSAQGMGNSRAHALSAHGGGAVYPGELQCAAGGVCGVLGLMLLCRSGGVRDAHMRACGCADLVSISWLPQLPWLVLSSPTPNYFSLEGRDQSDWFVF